MAQHGAIAMGRATEVVPFLEAVAAKAQRLQNENGSFPQGRNGPHNHVMTPVRNTCHWAVLFAFLSTLSGDDTWADVARRALEFVISAESNPHGFAYRHRIDGLRSQHNGLIGQAWTIEALLYGGEYLQDRRFREAAEALVSQHVFDSKFGLWRELDIKGNILEVNRTLNQQIWFTAMCVRCLPQDQARELCHRFLDSLPRWTRVRRDGLLNRSCRLEPALRTMLRRALRSRELPTYRPTSDVDVGYHLFTLQGLALLFELVPDHSFFSSRLFTKALRFAFSRTYVTLLNQSRFGFGYNVPGFEWPSVWGVFRDRLSSTALDVARSAFRMQLSIHPFQLNTVKQACFEDAETLAARYYEVYRIPPVFWQAIVVDHDDASDRVYRFQS